jgi:hypothetical protein
MEGLKREGATEVTPSVEKVARCDGASSLALAGICHFAFRQISRWGRIYVGAAVRTNTGANGYPEVKNCADSVDLRLSTRIP